MYRDTITLFNRYDNGSDDMWLPTIIRGADLNVDKAAIIAKYGENSTDTARLHIKYAKSNGEIQIADKTYFPPKAWKAQTQEQAAKSITFASGQAFDFFILGEWHDTEPINDADYTDGFYNFANALYDNCFAITSAAKYSVIPHFEIMAK